MNVPKTVYCLVCLTVGGTFLALAVNDVLIREVASSAFILIIAVLTFPLGFLGIIAGLMAVIFGLITPVEFIVPMTLLCTALGYYQWFHLLPRLFRRRDRKEVLEEVFK
jgi:uncharacterized membrane protein YkvI